MAEPALAPTEEVAAEQAAQQTTRLIVIQGGKSAAPIAETATAAETATGAETVGEGFLAAGGATLLAIGAALLVLLWPSEIAPEPPIPSGGTSVPCSGTSPSTSAPQVSIQPQAAPGEDSPSSKRPCPPHAWIVNPNVPGESPDESIRDRRALAKSLKNPESARGYDFEATAIEENSRKREIEATDREYICTKCGAIQEVDIVFKDGQLGECKSKNARQMAKPSVKKQAEKYVDIQRQLNEQTQASRQPLAKLDNSADLKNTTDQNGRTSKQIMQKRGYEIELLPSS